MTPVRSIVAAAATLALVASGAEAVMCIKKSGVVVVRDACRKKETPIRTTDFVGAPGPAGAAGAQGERGEKGDPGDFRVVDATGRFVGVIDLGHPDEIGVVVPGVGVGILYSGEGGSGFWQEDLTLYHERTDCKGESFVGLARYELIPFVDAFDGFAYFPVLPGSTRSISSTEFTTDNCTTTVTGRGLCCENLAWPEDKLVARTRLVPAETLGTPPFHVAY